MSPSYDAVEKIRRKICSDMDRSEKGTLAKLSTHDLAVFVIDRLNQSSHHGLPVARRSNHGINFIAIQAVLCNANNSIIRPIYVQDGNSVRYTAIVNPTSFVDEFVPKEEDPDINAYIAMFIGAVYRYQHRLATENVEDAISIRQLLLSLFEGYRNDIEVRYVHILNENAAKKSAIHTIIERIYDMYGRQRRKEGYMTVFFGDQPTFESLVWMFYDCLEGGDNDVHKCAVPITGEFQDEKKRF